MGKTADYEFGEPAPIPNDGPGMHDLAIADITQAWASTESLIGTGEERAIVGIIEDLENRKAFGLTKYGTLLQTNNGRNPLQDALEEALDLIVYIKQAMLEVKEEDRHTVRLDAMYRNAIEFAIALKYLVIYESIKNLVNQEPKNDSDGGAEASPPDVAG